MHWAMVGWSHHKTPVEIRELLAFSNEQVLEANQRFKDRFPEAESVLLSTCNRVELYCAANEAIRLPASEDLGRFLADFHGFPYGDVSSLLTSLAGRESIQHLFTVASSLDSMVIGEAQILSQVKSAYELACNGRSASALMHQFFQKAATVAKRVANETDIHKRRISIPSVAVSEIATEFFERFDDKRILLIGAGEMGAETLRYLVDSGAQTITVVNRNAQRATELAAVYGARTADWDQLLDEVTVADLIVSTTGADQHIVQAASLKSARGKRGSQAVLILDLAVPRDFESEVAQLPDVYLFTLDDLQQVCDRNRQARQEQWPKAQYIVQQETDKFLAELIHRGSGTTIKQLRQQADQVKQQELKRLQSKLSARDIDPELEKDIEVSFDRLVNKLLHPPMKSLRENADSNHHASLIDALRRLFQLKD